MKNKSLNVIILLLASGVALLGCERSIETDSALKLAIPTSQESVLAGTLELGFMAINIRSADNLSFPYVKEFDLKDDAAGTLPPGVSQVGNSLQLTINNPPAGQVLIQYLGVYQDNTTGLEFFDYGSTTANIGTGENIAHIVSTFIGQNSKSGRVMGRYLTGANSGPTGTLVMQFQPPSTNEPAMNLEPVDIVNGWFDIMLLDGAKLSYTLLETNQVIFDKVDLSSAIANPASSSTHVLKVSKAASFESDYDGARANPPEEVILGFFQPTGASFISTHKVCYFNGNEAVPGLFTDSTLTTPLEWIPSLGVASSGAVTVLNNTGSAQSHSNTFASTTCDPTDPTNMIFHHFSLEDHGDARMYGRSGPFLAKNPFKRWGGTFGIKYDSAGNEILLDWLYMPGVTSTEVSGIDIYAWKRPQSYYGGDNGGGDHDQSCPDRATNKGYKKVATVGNVSNFTFGGASNVTYNYPCYVDDTGTQHCPASETGTLSAVNHRDFEFMICPYRNSSLGKRYYDVDEQVGFYGDGLEPAHTGWAASTVTASPAGDNFAAVDGTSSKISDIDALSSPLYTTLTFPSVPSNLFVSGKEVMLHVVGENGTGCDNTDIGPGMVSFHRILATPTSSTIKIPKGSFVDQLDGQVGETNMSNSPIPSNNFCYIQAVQIPHFRDVTVSTGGLNLAGAESFLYGNAGGGVLALRVNGTLDFGDSITANGNGFEGAGAIMEFGAGLGGDATINGNTETGGDYQASTGGAGGGGGYGDGGAGVSGANGGLGYGSSMGGSNFGPYSMSFIFGGGGGGTDGGTGPAGSGGGIVLISANQVNVSNASTVEASGLSSTNDNVTNGWGGGGGGSIMLFAKELTGSVNLSLNTNGGNGTPGSSSGGGGAGGFINFVVCDDSAYTGTILSVNSGGSVNAQGGNTDTYDNTGTSEFCRY